MRRTSVKVCKAKKVSRNNLAHKSRTSLKKRRGSYKAHIAPEIKDDDFPVFKPRS